MTWEELGIKVDLRKTVGDTTCPKCSHTRKKKNVPCLRYWNIPGNRHFKCFHPSCGFSGNLEIDGKYKQVKESSKIPEKEKMLTLKARKYLESRGISQNTAKKFQLYEFIQYQKTIIGWPVFMGSTLVNVKFLNIDYKKEDKYAKWTQLSKDLGTKIIPIGMQLLKIRDEEGYRIKGNILRWCEGEIDTATWYECGYENIISFPQGAPALNAKNFDKEFAYFQDPYVKSILEEFDLHYIFADNDEAGKKLAEYVGMILGKEKCRLGKYPVGYKDSNQVYNGDVEKKLPALGKQGIDDLNNNVVSFPIKGIIRVHHVYEKVLHLREKGYEPGLSIGNTEIDKLFTLKSKLLYEFVGIAGGSKTTFFRWYLAELIKYNHELNLKFAIFPPESRPIEREYAKLAESITGLSIKKGDFNAMSDEQMRKVMLFIEKHFFIIHPSRVAYENFDKKITADQINTLDSILGYVAYLKKTENIFGYMIDPWNKIENDKNRYETETEYAGKQLDKIIYFNEYYDLASILLIHPTKTEMVGMNYKMPNMYSAKGSSAYNERADVGGIIHRNVMKKKKNEDIPDDADEDDKYYVDNKAPTIIKIEKMKFEEIGRLGKTKMEFKNNQFFPITDQKKSKKETPPPNQFIEPTIFDVEDEVEDLPF